MAVEAHVFPLPDGKRAPRSADEAIAELAGRQYGVVTRAQLLAAGVGGGAIEGRMASGMLQPLHRGVYAVGHRALRREGRWIAAVLAAGPGAALSHRSAPELWAIRQSSGVRIEVNVPRHRRSTPRLELHVVAMRADEVMVEDGIRVTSPARTLFDLATVLSPDQLEHAFNEAEIRRLASPVSLEALLARYPKRRGTATLKRVLAKHEAIGATFVRSELERLFLTLLDAYGLPRPEINRTTSHGELDARWPEQRLVLECDGWAAHGTRKAFEQDRARDRALQVTGWRVVRITWRQLATDGDTIARQLRALLATDSQQTPNAATTSR
jgi:predicted transcriptional regulator of viral defense system